MHLNQPRSHLTALKEFKSSTIHHAVFVQSPFLSLWSRAQFPGSRCLQLMMNLSKRKCCETVNDKYKIKLKAIIIRPINDLELKVLWNICIKLSKCSFRFVNSSLYYYAQKILLSTSLPVHRLPAIVWFVSNASLFDRLLVHIVLMQIWRDDNGWATL